MNDLILHIERLLPEHDCLVVPGLGGFVQNETEARLLHNKETFYPRGKEISFNARLTFNDGILVQSYQEVCKISFEEALDKMRGEVREIQLMLEEGKFVRFGRIGTIHKTDQGNLQYRPDNRNLFFPESYGLMPFAYPNLEHRAKTPVRTERKKHREDPFIHIRLSRRGFQNFLTGAAASLLILLIAKPAGNFENIENQKAYLLQEYIMGEPGNEGIFTETSVDVAVTEQKGTNTDVISEVAKPDAKIAVAPVETNDAIPVKKKVVTPVTKKNVSESAPKINLRTYYIIISSFPSKTTAENWLAANKKGLFSKAGIIEGDGRARIYINQLQDKKLAEAWLNKFRADNSAHSDAWLLSVKN